MPPRHEALEGLREIVRSRLADERAAARPRLDDPQELERAQGLTDRGPGDLELLRELPLRRELVAGAQVAPLEQAFDLLDDPLV